MFIFIVCEVIDGFVVYYVAHCVLIYIENKQTNI